MISHKGKTRTVGRFRCFIPHVLWMHCFICRRAVPIADWTKTPKKMQRLTRDRVSVFFLLKKWHFDLCFTGHWTGHLLKKISKDFSFGSEEKLREREIPFPVLTHKDREEHLVVESSVLRFVFFCIKDMRSSKGHQGLFWIGVKMARCFLFWISTSTEELVGVYPNNRVITSKYTILTFVWSSDSSSAAPHAWPMGTQKFPHPGTQEYLGTAAQGGEQLFSPYFLHHVYRWLSWCLIFCDFLLEQKDVWNLIWKKLLWEDVRIFFRFVGDIYI